MLSGTAIVEAIAREEIIITPYDGTCVGTNSFDVRLSDHLACLQVAGPSFLGRNSSYINDTAVELPSSLDCNISPQLKWLAFKDGSVLLKPNVQYLANTVESLCSAKYVAQVHPRTSLSRLGLCLESAGELIHTGSRGVLTLSFSVTHPLRVYIGMHLAQLSFTRIDGVVDI